MGDTRKWIKSGFPGVRYREHPTRKHGIQRDKYFSITYKLSGKTVSEGVGWSTEGITARKASDILGQLKGNRKAGSGPVTLAEMRTDETLAKRQREAQNRRDELEAITFGQFFEDPYFPHARANKKGPSCAAEEALFKKWLSPVLRDIPFHEISPLHLERVKSNMLKAERSPTSVKYAFAVVSQVWNMARRDDLVNTDCPTKQVKLPKIDNRRMRFLTRNEASTLLQELAASSLDLRDRALMSLHCGLRAGEIFNLTWADVDFVAGQLTLRGTKNGKNRIAFMTAEVKDTLERRYDQGAEFPRKTDYVFSARNGKKAERISKVFSKTVNGMGLNDGVTDSTQKIVFHSLRHTFASWLVQQGVPLYTVAGLMGHSTIAMTERYSHLAPDHLKGAVDKLEGFLGDSSNVVSIEQARVSGRG